MTVHAAKGLEFGQVFLCGMNEGIFPARKTRTIEAMEEERRIAFVAMTRAQDQLYLSCADGTNLDGSVRYPSRFVLDIEPELLSFTEPLQDALVKQARADIRSRSRRLSHALERPALEVGDQVRHAVFGCGTIVDMDAERGAYSILFEGFETARTLSWRAKLEPLSKPNGS